MSSQTSQTQSDASPPVSESQGDGRDEPLLSADAERARSTLPLDTVFEIIKNERRRLVLHHLEEAEGTVTIGELAERIAAFENDLDRSELNAQQRKRVYIGLYQCHLPKMDDAGVIEFNQDRGHAKLGPNADQMTPYLEAGTEDDSPSAAYRNATLALAIGAAAVFALGRVTDLLLLGDFAIASLVFGISALPWYLDRESE